MATMSTCLIAKNASAVRHFYEKDNRRKVEKYAHFVSFLMAMRDFSNEFTIMFETTLILGKMIQQYECKGGETHQSNVRTLYICIVETYFSIWYLWYLCRGISGFATDCPCDVWCSGLTTCLLHVGPPFGNRFLNTSWAVGLTYWIVYLHFFCILTYAIICLDTSYQFLALPLLLKFSLFFQVLLC